jgi:membrane fusion protein (multidrug efflux system)
VIGNFVFPAKLTGINNNNVRPKVSGYIEKVFVHDGERVKVGQPLFKLETNIMSQSATAAKAQVYSAEAGVSAAQVEVSKLLPLVEKKIISPIQLETANANLLKAKAQLSMAQADYDGIQENIKFSLVTSQVNGVLGKINYLEGSLVSPSDPLPLTVVSDISKVYAYFTLNEKQYLSFFQNSPGANLADKIAKVPEITLELANGMDYQIKGKLETTTGQIDPGTGTIQFRVIFDNASEILSNGSTGNIKIPNILSNVLVIPESATFTQQGFIYAYLYRGDTVASTVIGLIDRIQNMAIVSKGLNKGDVVVANGVIALRNGMKIQPIQSNLDSLIQIKVVK